MTQSIGALQLQRYSAGVAWVLSCQNRDGSWGRGREGRVTYTVQAVQLLIAAGFPDDSPQLRRAVRWLEDRVTPKDTHWQSRLEVGLKLGEVHRLASAGHISAFIADLIWDCDNPEVEDRLDLFWHVLPTAIAYAQYENGSSHLEQIPHDRILERLTPLASSYREDCMSILQMPNHTGLVALYVKRLEEAGRSLSGFSTHALVNWLFESRISDGDLVHWHFSRGITSYVLIDLLELCEPNDVRITRDIGRILRFLTPRQDGTVPGDHFTTFATRLHGQELYATMLSLRALAHAIGRLQPESLHEARLRSLSDPRRASVRSRAKRAFIKNRHRLPWLVPSLLCVAGAVALSLGSSDLGANLVFTAVGALLGVLVPLFSSDDS